MTSTNISFLNPVELNEAAAMVEAYGERITLVLKGEPGIGKSSVLKALKEKHGDKYDYIYVDCPVLDMSDIGMRIPNHDTRTLEFYASSLFKLDSSKPKMIMLDEFMKSPKLLQIIFTRMMLERTVGDLPLPGGSIVFATSNNSSDGVGDAMLAHAGNRVMMVNVRKPNANRWLVWASDNNISPEIRACVAMNPRLLASYLDGGQDDNPYIFNPSRKELSFVTNRSLAGSDIVVKQRDKMGDGVTQAALAGVIGAPAAQLLAAFMSLAKELVSVKAVIADPENVAIPEKPAALFMMMFNAIDTIETQDDLSAFMQFVNRIKSSEIQSVFFTMLLQSKRTVRLAKNNKQVMEWAKGNYELLI